MIWVFATYKWLFPGDRPQKGGAFTDYKQTRTTLSTQQKRIVDKVELEWIPPSSPYSNCI